MFLRLWKGLPRPTVPEPISIINGKTPHGHNEPSSHSSRPKRLRNTILLSSIIASHSRPDPGLPESAFAIASRLVVSIWNLKPGKRRGSKLPDSPQPSRVSLGTFPPILPPAFRGRNGTCRPLSILYTHLP